MGGCLTGRVAADVAGVLLRDALLQQPQAHAVLPAQTLVALRDRGAIMRAHHPQGPSRSPPPHSKASER